MVTFLCYTQTSSSTQTETFYPCFNGLPILQFISQVQQPFVHHLPTWLASLELWNYYIYHSFSTLLWSLPRAKTATKILSSSCKEKTVLPCSHLLAASLSYHVA